MSQETAWVLVNPNGEIVDGTNAPTISDCAHRHLPDYEQSEYGPTLVDMLRKLRYTFERVTVIPEGQVLVSEKWRDRMLMVKETI